MAAERHQVGRILAVVDGESGIEADARRVFAQQPRADRMEGAAVARRRRRRGLGGEAAGEDALDAAVELGRGAAREGRQHDALGVDAGKHEMGEAMGERRRLADPGAGDDQQRLLAMLDRQPLRVVQRVGGVGTNRGKRHGARGTRFGVCSQRLHRAGGGEDEGPRRSASEARRNENEMKRNRRFRLRSRKALIRKGGEIGEIHGAKVFQIVRRLFVSRATNEPGEARRSGRWGDARLSIVFDFPIFRKTLLLAWEPGGICPHPSAFGRPLLPQAGEGGRAAPRKRAMNFRNAVAHLRSRMCVSAAGAMPAPGA